MTGREPEFDPEIMPSWKRDRRELREAIEQEFAHHRERFLAGDKEGEADAEAAVRICNIIETQRTANMDRFQKLINGAMAGEHEAPEQAAMRVLRVYIRQMRDDMRTEEC